MQEMLLAHAGRAALAAMITPATEGRDTLEECAKYLLKGLTHLGGERVSPEALDHLNTIRDICIEALADSRQWQEVLRQLVPRELPHSSTSST